MSDKLSQALDAIDHINAQDPEMEAVFETELPKALLYGQRMSEALNSFAPDASEPLQLAVRAQHIKRWSIPRSDYPMDRTGYLKWRTDLAKLHAQLLAEIMIEVGYGEYDVERAKAIVQKKRLKQDDEAQLLEDVACLVFLEHYFAPFAEQHSEEKVTSIVNKTWNKMSPQGQQAAVALPLSDESMRLIKKALESV